MKALMMILALMSLQVLANEVQTNVCSSPATGSQEAVLCERLGEEGLSTNGVQKCGDVVVANRNNGDKVVIRVNADGSFDANSIR